MIWSNLWPSRWFRAKKSPLRSTPTRVRLAVEALEDRVVPSTVADYEAWKQTTFAVDDIHIADLASSDVPSVDSAAVPQNASFGAMIGLPTVFSNYPYRGDGYSVAIIDTGIDYNNANLGGGFGPGYRVVAGWDFANNDANPMDDNGHGTHVAGIVGSSSATYSGVAPNVNLIALKVLNAGGSGSYGAVESALQWVVTNQSKYNIVAINLSLGSSNYQSNPYTFLEDEFSALNSKGVFLAVAAGNSYYSTSGTPGLAYPAISPQVASVGAVYDGNFGPVAWGSGARDNSTAVDRVTSFSQRSSALSIMAPGAMITSTYLNNTMQSMAGTSMATPVVAGAAAILHQAMDARGMTANQSTILSLMKSTGVKVIDGDDEDDNVANTGLAFKRLHLGNALNSLGVPTNSAPVLQPIANQTIAHAGQTVVSLSATDPNGDPISFTATIDAGASSLATPYEWKEQLGLTFNGSYYTNTYGANEKWLSSTSGVWYCILPNGELRRNAGSLSATLLPENLITVLPTAYYVDPSLLWNASPVSSPVLAIVGNQLTIQADSSVPAGSYLVRVTASDGALATSASFTLTVQDGAPAPMNRAPVVQAIANQNIAPGGQFVLSLNATDPDGDSITFTATIDTGASSLASAYDWKQQLGLTFGGSYFTNTFGADEKWLSSTSGAWYCILPNGELRRNAGSLSATLLPENLITVLATRYYDDPSLLWDARPASAPVLTISGNQLSIQTSNSDAGSYQVQVTASDGSLSTSASFKLTVQNTTAPQLAAIADIAMQTNRTQAVTLAGSDPNNDPLTYSATISGSFTTRPATLILSGNQLTIHSAPDFVGSFLVRVTASDGTSTASTTFQVTVSASAVVYRMTGDFNGDRVNDTAFFNKDGSLWVSLTQADGSFSNKKWAGWNDATAWAAMYAGDVNNDGKSDIIAFAKQGTVWAGVSTGAGLKTTTWATIAPSSAWRQLQIGDFNGDRRTDIAAVNTSGNIVVGLSTGKAFTIASWGNWGPASNWVKYAFSDINGDGKTDLVAKNTLGQWYVGYSTGKTFTKKLWTSPTPPI